MNKYFFYYRKNSSSSPKAGYQKLSSNSFAAAEDRVSRTHVRDNEHVSHARTGSSPASMAGKWSKILSEIFLNISLWREANVKYTAEEYNSNSNNNWSQCESRQEW